MENIQLNLWTMASVIPNFSKLIVIFKDQPLNNDYVRKTATFLESQFWLLYTGLTLHKPD